MEKSKLTKGAGVCLNLADPTQRDAFMVTAICAVAAAIFWMFSLYEDVRSQNIHASAISFSVSSFIDLSSTLVVLRRFSSKDALLPTPENAAVESRASVVVALSLVALALVDTAFAIDDLVLREKPSFVDLTNVVIVSLPSQAVYLAVGMLQLQVVFRALTYLLHTHKTHLFSAPDALLSTPAHYLQIGFRLRSNCLTKDGFTSIFSAAIGQRLHLSLSVLSVLVYR